MSTLQVFDSVSLVCRLRSWGCADELLKSPALESQHCVLPVSEIQKWEFGLWEVNKANEKSGLSPSQLTQSQQKEAFFPHRIRHNQKHAQDFSGPSPLTTSHRPAFHCSLMGICSNNLMVFLCFLPLPLSVHLLL